MKHPQKVVNLERYPIQDLGTPAARRLIKACRSDLDETAICTLNGFIHPNAIDEMAREAQALAEDGYKNCNLRTPYGWMRNKDFPQDHPRSALFTNSNNVVLTHQFPGNTLIEQLYQWDPLTDFVREALGFKTLYRSACPHLSLMLSAMGEGDGLGWHFDTNDGVVSLLLQAPDDGGLFECAPYIRSEADENYDTVKRLFADEPGIAVRPDITPGTFVLFKGRRSCHRVTSVGRTSKPRMIALLSYDEQPGMVFPQTTVKDLMDPSPEPYHGQPG